MTKQNLNSSKNNKSYRGTKRKGKSRCVEISTSYNVLGVQLKRIFPTTKIIPNRLI